ncbi:MAG TPA: FG-GAP-like repeat-containing protein [Nostocaceae cyanobacterium]|nr:FG-GAP-like repeat-containing protein [Nostocaceae cyanobacterium]
MMLSTIERITEVQTPNYLTTLVVIDSAVPDYQLLVAGIEPTAQVIVLDQQQDGITQITAAVEQNRISSLQLIAHGSPGSLQLGNIALNLDNLHSYQQQLQQWQVTDILIYACEVAAGEIGQTFINQLHQLTGANIAASEQKVGHSQLGGSWELEVKIGQISPKLAINTTIRNTYHQVLVSFRPTANISVGANAVSVTVGDFNDDGKEDLATVNYSSNNVSVVLGQGDGTFSPVSNYNVGPAPFSAAVGDFNGDDNQDLVIANNNSDKVSLLLGQGDGTFSPGTDIDATFGGVSVIVEDFNGDTKQDLAVANFFSGTVGVVLRQEDGTFGAATSFSVGDEPRSMVVGDFNNDGSQDLVVANSVSNTVSVLIGQGDGTFSQAINYDVGSDPYSVAVGDFNSDGIQDLAVANSGSNAMSVLIGQGDGTFSQATNINLDSSPSSVAVGDFDGDSKQDLAVTTSNGLSVLLGQGDGTFASAINVSDVSGYLIVADFNDDGKQDLAIADGGNLLNVLLNNNPPTLATPIADQTATEGSAFNFTFLANTFNDIDTNDTLTYTATLENGDPLPAWLIFDAATRTFSGTPPTTGSLNIKVRATDLGNTSVDDVFALAINPAPQVTKLVNNISDIFTINSANTTARLQVSLSGRNSLLVNEFIVFTVDDDNGTVNGIAPGAAGYTEAVIARSSVVFSAIANVPNGFNTSNLARTLEFNANQNLRFALVKGTTLDAVKKGFVSSSNIIFSSASSQSITVLENNVFSLGWRDGSNNTTEFNDLVVNVQAVDTALPVGTGLQDETEGEAIDLTGLNGSVSANFTVYREALFENYVGFYKVTGTNGGIDTNNDGVADLLPGQAGYVQAAVNQRLSGIDLTVANQGTASYSGTFEGGAIFVPFIIVNGRPEAVLDSNTSNDPAVYFSFLGANSDGADHIRLLGDNIFGFEDLPGLGDADHNDVIVKVDLSIA